MSIHKKLVILEVPIVAQWLMDPTSIHEDTGSSEHCVIPETCPHLALLSMTLGLPLLFSISYRNMGPQLLTPRTYVLLLDCWKAPF